MFYHRSSYESDMSEKPLILVTNDDGIESPGLQAAAEAVSDLGELLIVAPSSQRTGSGRSYPPVRDKTIYPTEIRLNGRSHPAYKSDVSPAQAVVLAALLLAERPIDLCVSGINFGENIGSTVTTSGTVGAAMEAASFDIPALAVSLETPKEFHVKYSDEIDFAVASRFTGSFARRLLTKGLPPGVDLLKIDVPAEATANTAWQAGTVARQRYWHPTLNQPARPNEQQSIGYQARVDYDRLEPESDIHIFLIDRLVPVVPMTLDLTAPVDLRVITDFLNGSS
jgi:5'-nucleotidase